MYFLYIIASEFSPLLAQIFDDYRNNDNERLFTTMGYTDDVYTFAKTIDAKSGFESNAVIIMQSKLTEPEHKLLLQLSHKFSSKIFFVILPENYTRQKDVNFTNDNLVFITSFKLSKPVLVKYLINEIHTHLDHAQLSSQSLSTKTFTQSKNKNRVKSGYKSQLNNGVISVLGVSRGTGVTHTCILLANCLKKDKNVAVIELNNHRHFKEIFHKSNNRNTIEKVIYKNVHYFWNTNLIQFWTHFRQAYDYVIIDMGAFDDLYDLDEFLRGDIKIVMTHGSDWKLKELNAFYASTLKYDPRNQWLYGIPFLDRRYFKEIKQSIENKIIQVPFQMDPFKPSSEASETLYKGLAQGGGN